MTYRLVNPSSHDNLLVLEPGHVVHSRLDVMRVVDRTLGELG